MNKKLLYLFLAMHCAAAFAGDNQPSAAQKENHAQVTENQTPSGMRAVTLADFYLRNSAVLIQHGIYPDSSTAIHVDQRKEERFKAIMREIRESEAKKRKEMEEWNHEQFVRAQEFKNSQTNAWDSALGERPIYSTQHYDSGSQERLEYETERDRRQAQHDDNAENWDAYRY